MIGEFIGGYRLIQKLGEGGVGETFLGEHPESGQKAAIKVLFPPMCTDRAVIDRYFAEHRLPKHPLAALGFRSIGCEPCTTPVASDEDARAGRWRGTEKTECGIHFPATRS